MSNEDDLATENARLRYELEQRRRRGRVHVFWAVVGTALIVLFLWALIGAVRDANDFRDRCQARGGHIESDADGNPFCVTP